MLLTELSRRLTVLHTQTVIRWHIVIDNAFGIVVIDLAIDSNVKSLKGKVVGEQVSCGWTAVS